MPNAFFSEEKENMTELSSGSEMEEKKGKSLIQIKGKFRQKVSPIANSRSRAYCFQHQEVGLALTRLNTEHSAVTANQAQSWGCRWSLGGTDTSPAPPYALRTFACVGPPATFPGPSLSVSSFQLLVKVRASPGLMEETTSPKHLIKCFQSLGGCRIFWPVKV